MRRDRVISFGDLSADLSRNEAKIDADSKGAENQREEIRPKVTGAQAFATLSAASVAGSGETASGAQLLTPHHTTTNSRQQQDRRSRAV